MKNIVLFVVFIFGIVFMQFAQGQTVDEVINKYLDARGGKDKLNAIKSLYMEGIRQMMGTDVTIRITKVQGKLSRTDFEMGGTTGYTIITTNQGWSFIPIRSTNVEPMPADRVKAMQPDLDIAGPLVDYAAKGNKVQLLGKDTADGKSCYKVKLTLGSSGKDITYFIDTKTDMIIQTRQMTMGMGGRNAGTPPKEMEMITDYADYGLVEGVMFPHTISNPGAGPSGGSTTFDKIEINKPVPDSQYKPG
ncbi:MAG: hypothetical protein H0W12_05365 [Chitinophagaceae bacterium]|nr:hypothetical protein [Chitinophagaceae bacterium]